MKPWRNRSSCQYQAAPRGREGVVGSLPVPAALLWPCHALTPRCSADIRLFAPGGCKSTGGLQLLLVELYPALHAFALMVISSLTGAPSQEQQAFVHGSCIAPCLRGMLTPRLHVLRPLPGCLASRLERPSSVQLGMASVS